jgi:hypothetical protein
VKPPASYLVLQLGAQRIPEVATAQRPPWTNRNGKRVVFCRMAEEFLVEGEDDAMSN